MNETDAIRINKYLSMSGYCSRREADRLIESQDIFIDGRIAVMGDKVSDGQVITCKGRQINIEEQQILMAFNKPRGIVCTTSKRDKDNIVDYIGYDKRIYPIGRLDKESEGLILLTNNGELVNKILKASNYHEKEYEVSVDKEIDEQFIRTMGNGIPILNTVTRKCIVKKTGKCSFTIILTQGLNRQIRRMCEYCGYRVIKLKRVRILNIELGSLKIGTYRIIDEKEVNNLINKLKQKA